MRCTTGQGCTIHLSPQTNQIKLYISAHEEFCLFIPMCIHGHSSLLQSGFHRFPHAALRHTPLQEEENFSTIIAIAFTVPLVLVTSSLAGGAVELKTEGFNPLGSGFNQNHSKPIRPPSEPTRDMLQPLKKRIEVILRKNFFLKWT